MSTCPHCRGHLTDDHRCPRRPAAVILETTLAATAGGLAGLLLAAAIEPRNQITMLDCVAVLAGASIGFATDRFLRK